MRERAGKDRLIVLAGGGTAGHVNPLLAIAQAVRSMGQPEERILFVGSRRGQDRNLVAESGLSTIFLPGRGIQRVRGLRPACRNVVSLGALAASLLICLAIFVLKRPSVLVSVGGYAALPPALAAAILRVPIVVVSPDAVVGSTNRLLGRWAAVSAVAWEGTDLPRAVVTGVPLREALVSVDSSPEGRRSAKQALGLPPEVPLVLAVGGSLGAKTLNMAVSELAQIWAERSDVAIRHVVGRRDWGSFGSPAKGGQLRYEVLPYEDDMATALAGADVVVARAGAGSVAELAAVGRASVLVSLPKAPGDHQAANAAVLEAVGAAVVLDDSECDGKLLARVLDELLADPLRVEAMSSAAHSKGRRDAAASVAAMVCQIAETGSFNAVPPGGSPQ